MTCGGSDRTCARCRQRPTQHRQTGCLCPGRPLSAPSRFDGLLGPDDSPAPHDFLLILRRTHVPDWRSKRGRVISGRTVKTAAVILARYADYVTDDHGRIAGWLARPPISELAVDLQVSYGDAPECLKALVAYKLAIMTGDNRPRGIPNGYQLLNPLFSGLLVRSIDEFEEAGRRARVKAKGSSPTIRALVTLRDGGQCRYCGTSFGPFQVDHVVPHSLGGTSELDNLVLACQPCNQKKHTEIWEPGPPRDAEQAES